jgi:hypothetical protein
MVIPLLLHLFLRRRRKVVELSTFRFLFETYFQEGRSMKLLEYLLLALRMLILLFLGLCFARPALSPSGLAGFGRAGRAIVLVIDSSASMSAGDAGISRLEVARELAREVLARARPEDEITLINSHYEAEVLAAHVSGDIPLVRSRLDTIRPTQRTGRIGPALSRAAAVLRESPLPRKAIYWFSDCQKSAWDQYPTEPEQALLERDMSLCLVRVGQDQIENCALRPDSTPRTRAFVHVPTPLRLRLVNTGLQRKDVLFTLAPADAGQENAAPIRRELISLQPGEQQLLETVHTFESAGSHAVSARISGDGFAADDAVTLNIPVFPVAQVLTVAGKNGLRPGDSDAFFLTRALQPDLRAQDPRKILVRQTLSQTSELQAGLLAGKHVVILANVPSFSPAFATELKSFVRKGGGLLLFWGDGIDPEFYQNLSVTNERAASFLPAVPLRTFSGGDDPTRFTYFTGIDFQHPALALFQGASAAALIQPRFYRVWEMAAAPQGSRRLAAFSVGLDALREHRYGEGRVIVAAFPARVGWTSLPLKSAFVPLIHQLVAHLCPEDWKDQLQDPEIDQPLRIDLPHDLRLSELTLTPPDGKPTQLRFRPEDNRYVAVTNCAIMGPHQLTLRRPDKSTDTAIVTPHLAWRESLFEPVAVEGVRRLLPNVGITMVNAAEGINRVAEKLMAGRPLWRLLGWLIALLLLVEFLVANRTFLPKIPPTWRHRLFDFWRGRSWQKIRLFKR